MVFVWTDESGPCTDSVSVRFARQPIANVGPLNEEETCGNCVTFDADTTGSGWAQHFYWTTTISGEFVNPEGAESPQATFCADEAAFGDSAYIYAKFYWNLSNYGCIHTDTMYVGFYQPPVANAGIDREVCGNTTELGAVFDISESPNYTPSGIWTIAQRPNPAATADFDVMYIDTTFVTVSHLGVWKFVFRENNSNLTFCYTTDTVQVTFQPNNEVLPVMPLIVDDEPITLTALVEGGIWSGNGIIDAENGVFDPEVAGIGMHTVSYYIEDFAGCNGYTEAGVRVTGVNLEGYIYNDENENCIYDLGEGVANTLAYANPGPYYSLTDSTGKFRMYLEEGDYAIHANSTELFYTSCPETGFQNVSIVDVGDTVQNVNLGLTPYELCSDLHTNIIMLSALPGFDNYFFVGYFNYGSAPAEDAYIEIEFDDINIGFGSSIPATQVGDYTFRYNLGTIYPYTGGDFFVVANMDFDLELFGQTTCVSSTIYPHVTCGANFGTWDLSEIEVNGICLGENVLFDIYNTADDGDMLTSRNYRIFANDYLVSTGTFQLDNGEAIQISYPANGSAIRLEADQHPDHPYCNYSTHTVEGCGDANGTSYGYITTNTYGDEAPYTDYDCQIITGSYDPNNKEVQPSGISENHYIESNTLLTYRVNFQNTGTDTAFTVVIVDTLSSQHDILSFERGICSHPCEFEIYGNGILVWTFNNILLPDSAANEPESHGFVTYKVRTNEMSSAEYGTQIQNNAAIFFDFNPPVITNTTELVFWNLPLLPQGVPGLPLNLKFSIFPNPATQSFSIDVESTASAIEIFDTNGKAVMEITNYNGEQIPVSNLSKGLYFVKLISGGNISVGKLVVE